MPAFNPFAFFARQTRPILGHPFRNLVSTAKYLAVAHLFWEYGYSVGPAQGPSMLPTFEISDEWLLISKRHRHGRDVAVGDLVVYKIPIFPDSDGIKRVLGLPGDYVMLDSPESGSEAMIQVHPSSVAVAWARFLLIAASRFQKGTAGLLATTCPLPEIQDSLGLFRWL